MKSVPRLVVMLGLFCGVTSFGQEAAIPLPPPATDTIAPDIPGVVKGGTQSSSHRRRVEAYRWPGRDA